MALADRYFKEEVNKLLTEGFNDKDYEVRPKWPDGTPAHTIKTNIKVGSQMSIYAVMEKWCDLMQKCKDDHERFYGYYFDDETNTTYRLTNIYISNVGDHYDKEVKLSFNYDDKKEFLYQSDGEINSFFETYINASNIQGDAKIENKYCKEEK